MVTKMDSGITKKLNTVEDTVGSTKKKISKVQLITEELTKTTTEKKTQTEQPKAGLFHFV
ncbi:hypothetical protein BWGOE4_34480 [Bacillus mycoides]|uniref:hypothetical protein n=2 Tax=Bacillus mycoides TaxID=1405 RepID=UPI000872C950|nr:hypothetical protein [Bacillus mycoides]OFD55291.1 hypothetical protein BWGOE4_34480 [Bacillus mycoides]OFD61758.1 hypothetical protein BWGOE7_36480 [Bacillus mycoides]OFD92683.1 hypothetical protein BWGOE12_36120 [Bacillus mycoides]